MQINGFRMYRSEFGKTVPELQGFVLDQTSTPTFKEGQAVKAKPSTTVAGLDLADANTDNVYGIIEGFVTKNRLPLLLDTDGYDGTYTASPTGDSYVTTSDNLTDKKVTALVRPAKGLILSGLLSAAIGTTTGSTLAGNYFDILTTDCTKINEASVSATKATYLSIPNGIGSTSPKDPQVMSTTRILVKVIETQEFSAQ